MSSDDCTTVSSECPLEATLYGYRPALWANGILLAVFSISLIFQLVSVLFLRVRIWSYILPLAVGTAAECLGYAGRIWLNSDPWNSEALAMQIATLIIAPAFIAAAISVTCKHIVIYCGAQHSLLKPRLLPWIYIGTDFVCIVIQACGAAVLAEATSGRDRDEEAADRGNVVILFGVAFQLFNMLVCAMLMLLYMHRYQRSKGQAAEKGEQSEYTDPATSAYILDRQSKDARRNFRIFCAAMAIAFTSILIRCIYRIPEMAMGWGSTLMRNEPSFLVCDGLMIMIAVVLLSFAQPAFLFRPMMRKIKVVPASQEVESD